MPILREVRVPPEYIQQYRAMGPCVRVGMEVWLIEGKRLTVGTVQSIVPDSGIYIERADGTVFRTPGESVIMGEPEAAMKVALK